MMQMTPVKDIPRDQPIEQSRMDCSPSIDVQGPSQIISLQRIQPEARRKNLHKDRRKHGCQWPINYCVFLAFGITFIE
jgi:hypothetical protein